MTYLYGLLALSILFYPFCLWMDRVYNDPVRRYRRNRKRANAYYRRVFSQ